MRITVVCRAFAYDYAGRAQRDDIKNYVASAGPTNANTHTDPVAKI